jgi:hypothetical protein
MSSFNITINTTEGAFAQTLSYDGATPLEFYGFASTSNIASVTINSTGSQEFGFALDNFVFNGNAIAPPVPEPSTWAMMILGFASVGLMAYRRSRKDQSLALAAA